MRHTPAWFSLLLLVYVPAIRAQKPTPVDLLNSHFVGTWEGINRDFTVTPPRDLDLTISVVEDLRKHRLDMDYAYIKTPSSPAEHHRRLVTFEPDASSVLIDRKDGGGKERQPADGLAQLLKTGYGDFTLHAMVRLNGDNHAVERAVYHLTANTWNYELYVSSFGGPFVQTLACSLQRAQSSRSSQ